MLSKFSRFVPNIQRVYKSLTRSKKKHGHVEISPFLLLQLPSVSMEIVFKHMDPIDILNLSACSKNAAKRSIGVSKRNTATSCYLYLRYPKPSITILFRGFRKSLKWICDNEEKLTKKHIQEEKTFSGYLFKTCHVKRTPREIICRNENILEGFAKIIEHLLALFSVPVQVVVEPSLGDLKALFSYKFLAKCSELELTRGYRKHFFVREELEVICKKIYVKNNFKVDVDTGGFCMRQVFFVENVSLCNAKWMRRCDLLSLDCRTAKFKRHNFRIEDIEAFALKWQAKPVKPKLERLEFAWDPLDDISFDKLKTMKWDRKRRSKRCPKQEWFTAGTFDCTDAFDFTRKDGLLASIGIVDDTEGSILLFHVWHDRFPTKHHQELLQKKLDDFHTQLPEINRLYGVGSIAERTLSNRDLTSGDFQEILKNTYAHRVELFSTSPQLDYWFNFHSQILPVMKDIESLT